MKRISESGKRWGLFQRNYISRLSTKDILSQTISYRLPYTFVMEYRNNGMKINRSFIKRFFQFLDREYDSFNRVNVKEMARSVNADAKEFTALWNSLLEYYSYFNYQEVLVQYKRIDYPVPSSIHAMALSCLFHLDLLSKLDPSVVYALLSLAKSKDPLLPIDLSCVGAYLANLPPMTARMGRRKNIPYSNLLMILVFVFIGYVMFYKKGNMDLMSGDYTPEKSIPTKFSDVIGIDNSIEELQFMVDFLRNPDKFKFIGAKAPRGVLFTGPPGTGKTLLARAVAGEAEVPFFFVSGSEFDEVLVGVGARRVRKLFEKARKSAPCIVFIDELDAVGGSRDEIGGSNHTRQTINQLLNEIGGFKGDEGVLIVGATNLKDALDPALIRSGRFDLEVKTSLPNYESRYKILKLLSQKHHLADEVDLEKLAKQTVGCNGADLQTLLSVATMKALSEGSFCILEKHIEESRERLAMGVKKKKIDEDEVNYRTAIHESGHAVYSMLLKDYPAIDKITILPRGEHVGFTSRINDEKRLYSINKKELFDIIDVSLAGRAAEEILLGENNVSTNSSDDLEKVTDLVLKMVYAWGMTGQGLRADPETNPNYSFSLPFYSDKTKALNDAYIEKVIEERYALVKGTLSRHIEELKRLVDYLRDKDTITGENALRVIRGQTPVFKEVSEEDELRVSILNEVYRSSLEAKKFSLVDHMLIPRNLMIESEGLVKGCVETVKRDFEEEVEKAAEAYKSLPVVVNPTPFPNINIKGPVIAEMYMHSRPPRNMTKDEVNELVDQLYKESLEQRKAASLD